MSIHSIDNGFTTTQTSASAADQQRAAQQAAAARRVLSTAALDRFPAARNGDRRALRAAKKWRDDMYAALGLHQAATTAPPANPPDPDVPTPPKPRLATGGPDDDWRTDAACLDSDPEAFFPFGVSGSDPLLLQIAQAKAICRRCEVADECLTWAIESGQDYGVWGGYSEDERRAMARKGARGVIAESLRSAA